MDDEINNKMEEEKHYIALLVELDLYETLKRLDENMKDSKSAKEEVTETFIRECLKRAKTMDEQQIREHVQFVLNRTRRNRGEKER